MADIEIYDRIQGKTLEHFIAVKAKGHVYEVAQGRAQKASQVLANHRDQGHSKIVVDQGDIDSYVVLDDTRGLGAALSIEFGHEDKNGNYIPGPAPLHKAFPEWGL